LIFVQSKERAKELYKELAFDDVRADVIHADLTEQQVLLCVLLLLIHRYLLFLLIVSIVFIRLVNYPFMFPLLQRQDAVDSLRAGKTWVLIATEVIARGMDFKGLNCVINYDFPESAAAYIHRIGMISGIWLDPHPSACKLMILMYI
jgi:ATP-dependent RNA helicase DDX52/ROK1